MATSPTSLRSLPLVRQFRTREDLERAFRRLQKTPSLRLTSTPYDIYSYGPAPSFAPLRSPAILECDASDYEDVNWISDWYNHRPRLESKRFDEAYSPAEAWGKMVDDLPLGVLKDRRAASDALYAKVKGCGNFRPLVYRFLIDYFGATRVLDPCAGWGCRLLAAMAAGVEYEAADCQPRVHRGYAQAIKDWWLPYYPEPAIHPTRFQDMPLRPDYFDLVATSPPYYDLEEYPGSECPATEREWISDFLVPLLEFSYASLRRYGTLVLVINGKPVRKGPSPPFARSTYITDLEKLAESVGFTSLGVISYADRPKGGNGAKGRGYRSPQPMWIFRKGHVNINYPIPIRWVRVMVVVGSPLMKTLSDLKALTSGRPVPQRLAVTGDPKVIEAVGVECLFSEAEVWVVTKSLPEWRTG